MRQVLRVCFKRVAPIFKSMRPVSHKKPFGPRAVVRKVNSFRGKVHLSDGFIKESSKELRSFVPLKSRTNILASG